jgi:hypothetical protein
MAYFSNGTEGECFEAQCNKCKYGEKACPIYQVQFLYNYDAVNNDVATRILNHLVQNDGTCTMFKEFESDFLSQEKNDKQLTFEGETIV